MKVYYIIIVYLVQFGMILVLGIRFGLGFYRLLVVAEARIWYGRGHPGSYQQQVKCAEQGNGKSFYEEFCWGRFCPRKSLMLAVF